MVATGIGGRGWLPEVRVMWGNSRNPRRPDTLVCRGSTLRERIMYCLCGRCYCKRNCLGSFNGFFFLGNMAAHVADGTGCLVLVVKIVVAGFDYFVKSLEQRFAGCFALAHGCPVRVTRITTNPRDKACIFAAGGC
jgi:hypothetical protein